MEVKEIKHGYVKNVYPEKGYGFIRSTDKEEQDYFVRLENVLGGKLKQYQEVDFLPQPAERGPIALSVMITKDVPTIQNAEPTMASIETGYVKFFDDEKGYGFITSSKDNVTDYFAYYVNISPEFQDSHKTLKAGQQVKFIPVTTEKGPLALNIVVIGDISTAS